MLCGLRGSLCGTRVCSVDPEALMWSVKVMINGPCDFAMVIPDTVHSL